MIIAFDGNVFAGKTTIINEFHKTSGWNYIDEYSDFITDNQISDPGNYFQEHVRYLEVDRERIKKLVSGVNLLDRSFVSLCAHVYAAYKCGWFDIRDEHINTLFGLIKNNNIIIPNFFIFIDCIYSVAKKRYEKEPIDSNQKQTPEKFLDSNYYKFVREFNLLWQGNIDCGFISASPIMKTMISKINKFSPSMNKLSLGRDEIFRILMKIFN